MKREHLPVPRLQIEWHPHEDDEGHNWRGAYSLVYKHFQGELVEIHLGETLSKSTESYLVRDEHRQEWTHTDWESACKIGEILVRTPFRDGVHMRHDSAQLRLPAYAICGDVCEYIPPIHQEAK